MRLSQVFQKVPFSPCTQPFYPLQTSKKAKFMPNVYAILGESDTRKSSTVRALTGAGQLQPGWSVATTLPLGNIEVYVQIRSLQEEKGITPNDFINIITKHNEYRAAQTPKWAPVTNILIPLRISAFNNCPDGVGYLQRFAQAGWNIHQIVVLGATALPSHIAAPQPKFIPYQTMMPPTMPPANQISFYIRGWWNWF